MGREDTISVVKKLDLVITVDTFLAHLSPILECRKWVLLEKVPDWRWGYEKKSTNWYNNVNLIRQNNFQDWDSVFEICRNQIIEFTKKKLN